MFRKTTPQMSLLENQFLLPPKKRARLEGSWARGFRERILPLIDEELVRDCFDQEKGRPNKSISLLVALDILKEMFDLTDNQVIDALEFNLQIQYAVAVEARTAHVCQKTLHNHRVRMLQGERTQAMFERITKGLAQLDGVSVSRQRLDSTHVMSNMAVLTRLGLFVETITLFLRELRRHQPEKLEKLQSQYRKRYLERDGYFSDAKRGQRRRRLQTVASDLYWLTRAFEGDPEVTALGSYQTLVRLFEEQCELVEVAAGKAQVAVPRPDALEDAGAGVEEGGLDTAEDRPIVPIPPAPEEPASEEDTALVKLREGKEISPASLQSPHDPDATYGHKGKGYEVQVSETCGEGNPYQLITAMSVNGANESDQRATVAMVERLDRMGLSPEELVADTGYGSGDNIVACAELGVDLQAPVQDPQAPPKTDWLSEPVEEDVVISDDEESAEQAACEEPGDGTGEGLDLTDFVFDKTRKEVLECPGGQAPTERVTDKAGKTVWSYFDAEACATCPLAGQCPARRRKDGTRTLRHRPSKVATAFRQQEQRGRAFKEAYKIRSGIEATNAELKGRHGAGRLRVRRRGRVEQRMLTKGLAVNAKRASEHYVARVEAASVEREVERQQAAHLATAPPPTGPPSTESTADGSSHAARATTPPPTTPTTSQPPPPLQKLADLLKDTIAHHGSRLAKLLGGAPIPQPTGS